MTQEVETTIITMADYAELKAKEIALDAAEAQVKEFRVVAEQAFEAFRLTQEYVTPEVLPDIEGWSHYDAKVALDKFLTATTPA